MPAHVIQAHHIRAARTLLGDRLTDGMLAAKSEKAVFHDSTVVAVSVDEARIVRGNVLLLRAEAVKVEGDAKIGVLAGPACEAVRPLISIQGAAALGAAAGLVGWFLSALVRRATRG